MKRNISFFFFFLLDTNGFFLDLKIITSKYWTFLLTEAKEVSWIYWYWWFSEFVSMIAIVKWPITGTHFTKRTQKEKKRTQMFVVLYCNTDSNDYFRKISRKKTLRVSTKINGRRTEWKREGRRARTAERRTNRSADKLTEYFETVDRRALRRRRCRLLYNNLCCTINTVPPTVHVNRYVTYFILFLGD